MGDTSLSIMTICKQSTFGEYLEAKTLYIELEQAKTDMRSIITAIYKAGIIKGKRQERARRKGGDAR